jgi:nickel/cobalt exporter
MPDIASLIQQGAVNLWIFIPTAILLGALHGLEPGHSKTMMAAFIVAVRGTVKQAALLGLAATVSHTAVVWLVAMVGMYFFAGAFNAETTEPYFQMASGVLIIAIAVWMLHRTWKHQRDFSATHSHLHDETRIIDTGHGLVKLEIYEVGQPPRFRLSAKSKNALAHYGPKDVSVETTRADGAVQIFSFAVRDEFLESTTDIPEPHGCSVKLALSHGNHSHDYSVEFTEHDHGHAGIDAASPKYQDAHELAHADEIKRRFASQQNVTTGQIIVFGLTGGLIPCPASITILLLCLQLKKVTLGATLVLCFSIGLALTLVLSGVVAAISVRQVTKRWSGFSTFARKAPYFSSGLIILVGLYVSMHGLKALI